MAIAEIHDCPKCGEIVTVSIHKEYDTERDEVYEIHYCIICNSCVSPTGLYRWLDMEEMRLMQDYYDGF